jgi:hypothetical protein
MNEIFKSTLGKCFLYALLGIFIFTATTLIGCFVAGNTNVFEWSSAGRMGIIVVSTVTIFYTILVKEIIK